jgi:hypothetical protein
MKSWEEFVSRTPEEYDGWITGGQVEIIPFEIEKVNSLEHYNEYLNSGFKCFIREEESNLEDRYNQIIKHFKLI